MNLKSLLLPALCLLVVFVSCDRTDDDPTPVVPKIKTITHHLASKITSENYDYDQSGRLTKITYSDGGSDEYDYRKDTIIQKNIHFYKPDTILLNHDGLVISEMYGNIDYEYHPDGFIATANVYDWEHTWSYMIEYQVSDGNITVLDIWEPVNGIRKVAKTYHFEYLANSVNTIGNENKGMTFYGKQDKNLVSIKTLTDHVYNSQENIKYQYTLDAKKRVIKRWVVGSPEDQYDSYSYYN